MGVNPSGVMSSMHPEPEYDYRFRIIINGDSGAGKTNLLLKFAEDAYKDDSPATIRVNFKVILQKEKHIELDFKRIKMVIWDTAGQDRFETIRERYYRGCDGIIVVYDVTDPRSFENVSLKWLKEIDRYASKDVNILLVGTKCDSPRREVEYVTAKELADKLGITLFEVSAKNSTNVEQAFMTLAAEIKRRMELTAAADSSRQEETSKTEEKEHKENFEASSVKVLTKTEERKGEEQKRESSHVEASTQTEEEIETGKLDIQDFKEMLFNGNTANVVLKVGNQESRAHRCVMAARSPCFLTVIIHETKESVSSVIDFKDIDLETFPDFLNFLCTGKIEKLSLENALKLYTAAVTYKIDKLKRICMDYLMLNISTDNFCDILTPSLQPEEKDMKDACFQYFLENSLAIVRTSKWSTFLCKNPTIGNELFIKHLELSN